MVPHPAETAVPGEERTDLSGGLLERSVPTGIEVAQEVWMRKRGLGTLFQVAFYGANALFYGGLGLTGLLGLALGRVEEGVGWVLVGGSLMLALGVLAGRTAVRMARAGLRISPRGVSVRGVFRTHDLSLSEVARFAPAVFSSGLLRSEVGVAIVRRKGRNLPVWALRGGSSSGTDALEDTFAAMQPLCDELNRLLGAVKGEDVASEATGPAEDGLTRREADEAYRKVRAAMVFSVVWFGAVAALTAILGFDGWQLFLAAVVALEGIGTPLALRYYRRELERKVREGETALGKLDAERE
jgi:hypothetical protein